MASSAVTESDILADVIAADRGDLPPDVAHCVLQWKFTRRATTEMNRLAGRNRKGTITGPEREVLERYLRIGSFINLLQAKARLSLRAGAAES